MAWANVLKCRLSYAVLLTILRNMFELQRRPTDRKWLRLFRLQQCVSRMKVLCYVTSVPKPGEQWSGDPRSGERTHAWWCQCIATDFIADNEHIQRRDLRSRLTCKLWKWSVELRWQSHVNNRKSCRHPRQRINETWKILHFEAKVLRI
jgi:hypothetical protein